MSANTDAALLQHVLQNGYPEFAERHPELPLAFVYQMRNAVVHGCFKVDY